MLVARGPLELGGPSQPNPFDKRALFVVLYMYDSDNKLESINSYLTDIN